MDVFVGGGVFIYFLFVCFCLFEVFCFALFNQYFIPEGPVSGFLTIYRDENISNSHLALSEKMLKCE